MPAAKHIPSLDGIRGLAVLLVVTFHFLPRTGLGPVAEIASFGWSGVDAFLVLSGFLITGILYRQRESEHFFRNFYTRRVLRLFPLYYFILCAGLLLAPVLHFHWRAGQLPFFFYAANVALWRDQGLGSLGPFNLRHFWTLALEEQFYFVWPWIVGSALSKKSLLKVCAVGIAIAVTLRVALLFFSGSSEVHRFVDYSLPTRMDSLLVGAALALMPLPSVRTVRWSLLCAVSILGLIVYRARTFWPGSFPMSSVGYTTLAILFASLLALSLHEQTFANRVFSTGFLRFYGKYSYGIYLWHFLFSSQFYRFTDLMAQWIAIPFAASLASFAVILLTSTLIAMASYHLLEQPFLRLKARYETQTWPVLTKS